MSKDKPTPIPPRPRLAYHTMIQVSLHLEPYHNAGMTPEQTRAVIERQRDMSSPYLSGLRLMCSPAGINNNWAVHCAGGFDAAQELVEQIEYALYEELRRLARDPARPLEKTLAARREKWQARQAARKAAQQKEKYECL